MKVTVKLCLWRLREHADIAKLLDEHEREWSAAFCTFVERNLASVRGRVQLALHTPMEDFPLTSSGDGADGKLWCGHDLSDFIQVIPTRVQLAGKEEAAETEETTFEVDPAEAEWSVSICWMEDDGYHGGYSETSASSFRGTYDSMRSYRTVPPMRPRHGSILSDGSSAAAVSSVAPSHGGDHQQHSKKLSMAMTTLILSCLLQYTPEMFGIASPHSFTVLRRFIIPEIVDRLHQYHRPESDQRTDGLSRSRNWNSFVEFDRGILQNTLEEWFSVGGAHPSASGSGSGQYHRDGRAAGLILTSAKGVGKTMFGHDILQCLSDMAPWMVTVVYDQSSEEELAGLATGSNQEANGTPVNPRRQKFFDGTYFLDSQPDTEATAHVPLSHGPFCLNEASPRGIMRMTKLFQSFKAASRPGVIVLTMIDNMDLLIKSVQSHCIFTQLRAEMENADFEFFILGTSSDATLPSFDSIDSSKNQFRVINFRTLKLYTMPLQRAYEFVLRYVRFAPPLAYPEHVMKRVRRCAIEMIRQPPMDPNYRKEYERRLHSMHIYDLRKLSLHLCVDLAKSVNQLLFHDPSLMDCNDSNFYCSLMMQSMERVFNACSTISGLAPPVNTVMPWIRQDMRAEPSIKEAVNMIFQKCTRNKQFVHFVRLAEAHDPATDRYDHPVVPMRSVHSFLHHLHKRFAFRSSFVLESPEQLLPKNPKLSATTPRNNCNPFDEYYWQNKNSCLIVNTAESVVGYLEQVTRGYHSSSMQANHKAKISNYRTGLLQMLNMGVAAEVLATTDVANGNTNTEASVTARRTGMSGGVGFNDAKSGGSIFGGLTGELRKIWANERAVGNSVSRAITKAVPWGLQASAQYVRSKEASGGRGLATERAKFDSVDRGYGRCRVFEHMEALSKLVVGLKSVTDRSSRYADELRNVILIFYVKEGCFEEIAIRRLGWGKDGSYTPLQLGCRHYSRSIRVLAPCCQKWVDCEHCHNEECPDHSLDPTTVEQVQCLICYTRQTIVDESEEEGADKTHGVRCCNPNCMRPFSTMHCVPCRIWRDFVGPDGIRHCSACNKCYPANYYLHHRELCCSQEH